MAKDFADIKTRVEFYIDDTMTPDTFLMLMNSCQEDISFISAYAIVADALFDAEQPTMLLPSDFIEAIELKFRKAGQVDYLRILPISVVQPEDLTIPNYTPVDTTISYELFGDTFELRFANGIPENGDVLFRYFANLPNVNTLADVPKIKPRFHDMYSLFAAAKYFQNYQDELQAKMDYWGEYQVKRAEMEQEFLRLKARSTSRRVYQFRRWM